MRPSFLLACVSHSVYAAELQGIGGGAGCPVPTLIVHVCRWCRMLACGRVCDWGPGVAGLVQSREAAVAELRVEAPVALYAYLEPTGGPNSKPAGSWDSNNSNADFVGVEPPEAPAGPGFGNATFPPELPPAGTVGTRSAPDVLRAGAGTDPDEGGEWGGPRGHAGTHGAHNGSDSCNGDWTGEEASDGAMAPSTAPTNHVPCTCGAIMDVGTGVGDVAGPGAGAGAGADACASGGDGDGAGGPVTGVGSGGGPASAFVDPGAPAGSCGSGSGTLSYSTLCSAGEAGVKSGNEGGSGGGSICSNGSNGGGSGVGTRGAPGPESFCIGLCGRLSGVTTVPCGAAGPLPESGSSATASNTGGGVIGAGIGAGTSYGNGNGNGNGNSSGSSAAQASGPAVTTAPCPPRTWAAVAKGGSGSGHGPPPRISAGHPPAVPRTSLLDVVSVTKGMEFAVHTEMVRTCHAVQPTCLWFCLRGCLGCFDTGLVVTHHPSGVCCAD